MGLACNQVRLLTLTERKSDCEFGITIASQEKMAISREMSELSQEYYSKLQSKNISYYANGKYNKINYQYLMGYGSNTNAITQGNHPLKEDNSMILTDYNGRVVLDDEYANAITKVLGVSAMNADGRGGTFSTKEIAKILENIIPGKSAEDIQAVIDGEKLDSAFNGELFNISTGEKTGETATVDVSDKATEQLKSIIDFYYPIFAAAATNGWTTEYNKEMQRNEDYVSDALVTGSFQLATTDNTGEYGINTSLTYFITTGLVEERSSADEREEVTAWYNAEKARISEKETYLDLEIDDLSTELEAINTEIQSVQSLIDDAISSVFDWGSG